jgi:hypothetical protein
MDTIRPIAMGLRTGTAPLIWRIWAGRHETIIVEYRVYRRWGWIEKLLVLPGHVVHVDVGGWGGWDGARCGRHRCRCIRKIERGLMTLVRGTAKGS